MHPINDGSRAGALPLATDVLILECDHPGLDLQNIPHALECILTLGRSEPLLNGVQAFLTHIGAIVGKDFGGKP